MQSDQPSINVRCVVISTTIRTKMGAGVCTLRATAPCLVVFCHMLLYGRLAKDPVMRMVLWRKDAYGFLIMVLNVLYCWIEDPNLESFKSHLPRVHDYLWVAEDGMKMQGYIGSQLCDTAFVVQAILSTNPSEEYYTTLNKVHSYVNNSQVLDNSPGDLSYWYHHISKGAWPFSTADHGWPISDCTSEGLKAAPFYYQNFHQIWWVSQLKQNDCMMLSMLYFLYRTRMLVEESANDRAKMKWNRNRGNKHSSPKKLTVFTVLLIIKGLMPDYHPKFLDTFF